MTYSIKELLDLVATEKERNSIMCNLGWCITNLGIETEKAISILFGIIVSGAKIENIAKLLVLLDTCRVQKEDYSEFILSVINATHHIGISEEELTDNLFMAVRRGKVTLEELSNAIAEVTKPKKPSCTFEGQPINDMSRDELIEALETVMELINAPR